MNSKNKKGKSFVRERHTQFLPLEVRKKLRKQIKLGNVIIICTRGKQSSNSEQDEEVFSTEKEVGLDWWDYKEWWREKGGKRI